VIPAGTREVGAPKGMIEIPPEERKRMEEMSGHPCVNYLRLESRTIHLLR
jgi:hypothetical protein